MLNISFLQIICFFCFNPKAQSSAVRLVERSKDNKNGFVRDKIWHKKIDFNYIVSFEKNIYIAGAVSRDRVRLDVYGRVRLGLIEERTSIMYKNQNLSKSRKLDKNTFCRQPPNKCNICTHAGLEY